MNVLIKKIALATALTLAASQAFAEAETYKIDNSHSFANWSVRHVVSKTSGTFSDVTGTVTIDRSNLANSSVNAKINLLSVNSSLAKRDEHIKKAEYLDVEKLSCECDMKSCVFVFSKVPYKVKRVCCVESVSESLRNFI